MIHDALHALWKLCHCIKCVVETICYQRDTMLSHRIAFVNHAWKTSASRSLQSLVKYFRLCFFTILGTNWSLWCNQFISTFYCTVVSFGPVCKRLFVAIFTTLSHIMSDVIHLYFFISTHNCETMRNVWPKGKENHWQRICRIENIYSRAIHFFQTYIHVW